MNLNECWNNGASIVALPTLNDGNDIVHMNIQSSATVVGSLIGIGGGAADTLSSNGGTLSVLIGDYGSVTTVQPVTSSNAKTSEISKLVSVQSTFVTLGDTDHISGVTPLNGRTVLVGGSGNDQISMDTSNGDVTICGDQCTATFAAVGSLQLMSHVSDTDGDDGIQLRGIGSNVFAIGGSLNDQVNVVDATFSILIGDYGSMNLASLSSLPLLPSRDLTVLLDTRTLNANDGGGNDQLTSASSTNVALDGVRSIILGGSLNDIIRSNGQCTIQCGDDCILSSLSNGQRSLTSTLAVNGGNDRLSFDGTSINGATASFSSSILIGGAFSDKISSMAATSAVLGDIGSITYTPSHIDSTISAICWSTASLQSIPTPENATTDGNDDIHIVGVPNDVQDTSITVAAAVIAGGGSLDLVDIRGTSLTAFLGDFGDITIEQVDHSIVNQRIVSASTSFDSFGGIDRLRLICSTTTWPSLASRAVVFGGSANDELDTQCTCATICGDHCVLADISGGRSLSSIAGGLEGRDSIHYRGPSTFNSGSDGTLMTIGGAFDDSFTIQSATSTLIGDVGTITFTDSLLDSKCYSLQSAISESQLLAPTVNVATHNDAFVIDSGRATLAIGGAGNDSFIVLPSTSTSIVSFVVCGDDCNVIASTTGSSTFFASSLQSIISILIPSGADNSAGDDVIDLGRSMNSIIIGNDGHDNITSGVGSDFICGDNCAVSFDVTSLTCPRSLISPTLATSSLLSIWSTATVMSTHVIRGGNDFIVSGNNQDLIIGGVGSDTLFGNEGSDIIFGDCGAWTSPRLANGAAPLNQTYTSIPLDVTSSTAVSDTIYGGDDDDFIVAGNGNDLVYGGDGNDDIVMGHNVRALSDAHDIAYGNDGDDVILGDNAAIIRTAISLPTCAYWPTSSTDDWLPYNGNGGVIREVNTFDVTDLISGDDQLYGGNGDDRIFGQRGNDQLYGNNGDDEVIGGLGNDHIVGADGSDLLIGDIAHTRKQRLTTVNTYVNGQQQRWSYQLLLEEVGSVIGTASLTPTRATSLGWANGDFFVSADQLIIGGLIRADSTKVYTNAPSSSWYIAFHFVFLCFGAFLIRICFGVIVGRYMPCPFD
jgi:Ca2+-binding RTX toxin-like protein